MREKVSQFGQVMPMIINLIVNQVSQDMTKLTHCLLSLAFNLTKLTHYSAEDGSFQ